MYITCLVDICRNIFRETYIDVAPIQGIEPFGRMEVQLFSFFTAALDRVELLDSSLGHFTARERPRSLLKEGWLAFRAGLNVFEGKSISVIFSDSNHSFLGFSF